MDKKKITDLCEQILMASDNIVSIGAMATRMNSAQLMGIQSAVRQIAAEVNKPEEVAQDG